MANFTIADIKSLRDQLGTGMVDTKKALEEADGDVEKAEKAIAKDHFRKIAGGGFVTGLGGLITLPVALPANVLEFYLLSTRAVAAIAHLRGHDVQQPELRSAILLTLVGADARDILTSAGIPATLVSGGRLASLASRQLPAPALMVVNKAVGFRILAQTGEKVLTRLGKAIPLAGGFIIMVTIADPPNSAMPSPLSARAS